MGTDRGSLNFLENKSGAPEYVACQMANSGWVCYLLPQHAANSVDKNKFHIAVEHESSVITKTIELILPILTKYKIAIFKHADITYKTSMELLQLLAPEYGPTGPDNLDGKVFCVFLQDSELNSITLAAMIKEMETALKVNNIPMHKKGSMGDGVLKGCQGYIHYRNPNNVAGNYLGATFLHDAGFTRLEAQNIAKNTWAEGVSAQLTGVSLEEKESKLEAKDFRAEAPDMKMKFSLSRVAVRLKDQLKKQLGMFKKACLGDGFEQKFKGTVKFLQDNKKLDEYFDFKSFLYTDNYKLASIKPYLKEAAKLLTLVHASLIKDHVKLGINKDKLKEIPLGMIAPVLYHQFFKPLYEQYTKNKTANVAELVARCIDHKKLVTELVKCSLRDPDLAQIWHDSPTYIYNLTEAQMATLMEGLPAPFVKDTKGMPLLSAKQALFSSLPLLVPAEVNEAKVAVQKRF